jgi:ComF family protein
MADMFNGKIQETSNIGLGERYAYAAALFYYQSEAGYKKITQQLKYHSNLSAGRHFAKMLGHELANSLQFKDVDCVMPVPLHWTRRWKRGYNQSEVIASELAVGLKAALETRIIYRARHTRTQTKLSMEEKSANVCSAFRVRKCALRQLASFRHILLVDDVFTTGATLTACYRTLREGFPSTFRISIATLGFVGR